MNDVLTGDHRLATYGSLAPGRLNHHHLADIKGCWLQGVVYGRLVQEGWGADLGFPALVLDPAAPAIDVYVFESADLPAQWARLDDFEGPGYERVPVAVHTLTAELEASIYALRPPSSA